MKTMQVPVRLTTPVSLRMAWDMSRACNPMWLSPISPSSSALGTSAATESITTTSMAPEAIQFGLGNQRRHRIDHHHIYGSGGGQRRGDFERLLAVVRLRHQQV